MFVTHIYLFKSTQIRKLLTLNEMKARFFATQYEFREWLEANHTTETELLVGFYKVNSGKPSMKWPESVDQALCFGWIDGVRKSIDSESYCIRFTPRRTTSIWSGINIQKVEELTEAGLMKPEGLIAFSHRKEHRMNIYSHENESQGLPEEFESLFKNNTVAWAFFQAQAPSYQKVIVHWITSAKQLKTKRSRLEKAISDSEMQRRVM